MTKETTIHPMESDIEKLSKYLLNQEIRFQHTENSPTRKRISIYRKNQPEKYNQTLENFYSDNTPFSVAPTRGTISRLYREARKGKKAKTHEFEVSTMEKDLEMLVEFWEI